MSTDTGNRPLSPHLSVYRFHLTMALSIIHRILGVALAGALVLVIVWLWAAAYSPECFAAMAECLKTPLAQGILLLATCGFYLKMALGIRHLVWDAGYGFEVATARKSGL